MTYAIGFIIGVAATVLFIIAVRSMRKTKIDMSDYVKPQRWSRG